MEYVVVHFTRDDTVGVSHVSWLEKKDDNNSAIWYCYWPIKNPVKLCQRKAKPDGWPKYEVKIISYCTTYSEAHAKMLKSEETSHVSSDEEDEQPKKRRRTRPVRWSDDESENSDSLMSQVPSRNSASYSHQKNVLPTPLPQRRPSMSNSLISAPVQPQRFPPMTPSSTSRENQSTPVQQQTRVPVRSLVGSSTDILIKGFEAIVKCANTIIDNQEEIISIMRNQVALRPDDNDDEDPINKPLNTQEEFAALEEKLVNNPEFRKKFTAWLLTIRGAEHNAKIRQIMRNIGTNKMWSSWSLYGKKGKFAFVDTAVCKIILKRLRKMYKNIDGEKMYGGIADFLKSCPFQPGGSKYKNPAAAALVVDRHVFESDIDEPDVNQQ